MKKNKFLTFFVILVTIILAIVAIYIATKLYGTKEEEITKSSAETPVCLIYAVHDAGSVDSQFITIDPKNNYAVQPIGPLHKNLNVEGLDMDPITKTLYGSSGPDSRIDEGVLYKVDKTTGQVERIGDIGYPGVPALSFRPSDNTLWGWADDNGLITIDKTTGKGTLVMSKDATMQGMAWSKDGQTLYISDNAHSLYAYNPSTNTMKVVATNLIGQRTEALEMSSDDTLFGSYHSSSPERSIFAYDTQSTSYVASKNITTQYNDIEGISWPDDCGPVLTPGPTASPTPQPTYEACSVFSFELPTPSTTPSPTPVPGEPSIDIEKHTNGYDADEPKGPELTEGDDVKWEYIVTNIGDKTLYNVAVVDNKEGTVTCPKTTLLADETMTCVLHSTAKVYQYSNSATVTGEDSEGTKVTDTDTSHYWGEGKPYSPTPSPTSSPTAGGGTSVPKSTSTTTAIAGVPTSSAEPLPTAGVSTPTLIGISSAVLMLVGALLLVI